MGDLELAISTLNENGNGATDVEMVPTPDESETVTPPLAPDVVMEHGSSTSEGDASKLVQDDSQVRQLDLECGNHVIALFEDTYYPAEVVDVTDETVKVKCMEPMKRKGGQHFTAGDYWIWSSREELHTISKLSILDIYPVLDIMLELSTTRIIVFKLMNNSIIKSIAGYEE